MKKIFNFLKTLVYGLWPACMGGVIALDVIDCVRNIIDITTCKVSGWNVVLNFILIILECILAILLLYELGRISRNSNNWIAYNNHQQLDDAASDENIND